jgi:hypothetical protein
MANFCNQHPKLSGRKKRQPIGVPITKPKPAKAKRKLPKLGDLFCGWEDLAFKPLAQRVDAIRQLGFFHLNSEREQDVHNQMTDKMRTLAKLEPVSREAN